MERTYQSLNKNEVRAIRLRIDDQNGASWTPSGAYAQVLDSDNDVVVTEQAAMVTDGSVFTIINTTVTSTVGSYTILWRMVYGRYTFYHATDLEVHDY